MLLRLGAGILLAAATALADDVTLVPAGAQWRWCPGRSEASTPAEAWRGLTFNDGAWAVGAAGFTLGYGADETTVIATAPDFTSVFFRHRFSVVEPGNIAWLLLRIDSSGGFVAYLNGVEVARRGLGLAGSPVPYNAPAQGHPAGVPEVIDLSEFRGLLQAGSNLLAIQWHNPSPLPYGAALVPELRANFQRGPFLQSTTATTQTVVWETAGPANTVVEYGPTPELGERYESNLTTNTHVATLTGLTPDTGYYYRVSSSAGGRTGRSPISSFRTFRLSGPLSFAVLADMGSGTANQFAVARVVRELGPDLVLMPGDLVYPKFVPELTDFHFFSIYAVHQRQCPYFVTAGNHDVSYSSPQCYYDSYWLPTNNVPAEAHLAENTTPESYYSFDHGDAHFVGLYVPLLLTSVRLEPESAQVRWLESDLAATRKPWKFVFLHHPLFTSNGHRNDDYNENGVYDPEDVRRVLLPVFRRHGVQVVFSGHDHVYERFNPVDGVIQIVDGLGGGPGYGLYELDVASAQFWPRQHCVHVRIANDTLELQALSSEGEVFDRMFLHRAPPASQTYVAAWHSPDLGAELPADGDGNRSGQRFDMVGDPIPTAPGDFSNLGRVYVNYDRTNLYVGCEQPMLHGNNTLFLFLETPGYAGVTTLAGLGNGRIDPTQEGADGLDFLENLAFTSFAPCVALVLGDEFADGTFRSFPRTNVIGTSGWPPLPAVRTNLALDTGQGAFRLDAGLISVPGARIQQFNRSPQLASFAGEQNANFIVAALPLAALGLQLGSSIRLGAVVGGAEFSTDPAQPGRFLDRSFLGNALHGAGWGPLALEGVRVELGPDLDADGDGLWLEEELQIGTNPADADTDHDGLSDGWEVRNRLDPRDGQGPNGADGDPDADGLSNRQESRAGTDPRDATSPPRLNIAHATNDGLRFEWEAVPGASYWLEWAPAATGPFRVVASSTVVATSRQAGLTLVGAVLPGTGTMFYRLASRP